MLTLDHRRVGSDIANAINDLNVFHEDARCLCTSLLLQRRLIYRMSNWERHVNDSVGPDIKFLVGLLNCETRYSRDTWIPPEITARAIKAEFRLIYFVHGMNGVQLRNNASYISSQNGEGIVRRLESAAETVDRSGE